MLVQRQTPSVQVFNRVGSGMHPFEYIFCPQTLFARLLLVISLYVFLLVCTHVQSVLELSVLGLGSV